jgi:hypothetical protein
MKTSIFTTLFAVLALNVFASQNKAQVSLQIESPTGKTDDATVFFDQGVNPLYNVSEDVQKVYPALGIPVIYTLSSDLVDCGLNGFGTLAATEVIALGCDVDANGSYKLSASWLDNVNPTSVVRLEDRQAGVFTDLRSSIYSTQINANDPITGRFFLHISTPAVVSFTNAGCSNNDGVIHVEQDNTVAWDAVKLLDVFNNQVGTYNNATGQFDFTSLPEGDYYMVFILGNYNTTQEFHINSNYVTADITASKLNVVVGESISFSAVTTNANQFNWDFGDGTLITGVVNPTISYYQVGTYTVNLISANDHGCSDNAQAVINVTTVSGINDEEASNVNVFANGNTITVNMNGTEIKDGQMQVYNMIGQSVYSHTLKSQYEVATLSEPNGCYLVSVKNAGATITKRIFIGN